MKKLVLLGVAFLGCSIFSMAQKANWGKVSMSYIQLPLKPVSPLAKKYALEVIMDAEGVQQSVHNTRDELVNSITQTNQVLAKQGKPQQIIPTDDSYYAITRDGNTFKAAIKLDGCEEVTSGNEFSIVVKVVGFNLTSVSLKQANQMVNGVNTPTYAYRVTATYIVKYEVYDVANSMVRQEAVSGTSSPLTKTTKAYLSQDELDAYWNTIANKNSFLNSMDEDLHKKSSVCNKCSIRF